HARPLRRAGDGGGRHRAARRRHRHLLGRAARADRHRQGGRDHRPPVERPVRARHRVRLERRRDRRPRRGDARAARGHPGAGLAMKALWTDDVASFDGAHVRIAPSWSWPKPVRSGGPPVLIGGAAGPKLFAHVAEYADGWIPIGAAGVKAALVELQRACDARGRDPSTLRIVPFGTVPDAGKLEYYESIGIDEVVLRLPG